MKRLWLLVAIVGALWMGGAERVGAQATITAVDENFVDSVICPDGCERQTVVAVTSGGILTGDVYVDPVTKGAIPTPGGYDLVILSAYSAAKTSQPTSTPTTADRDVGEGTGTNPVVVGTLGTQYADGRYAGFYKAPNGKYYPIDVSKKATRNWPGKGVPAPVLDCPDDSQPDFGAEADVNSTCMGGQLPTGNRVKFTGSFSQV